MALSEFKQIILSGLTEQLKPLGFKKKGSLFQLKKEDLTYSIQMQSSLSSTQDALRLTVNIFISSDILNELDCVLTPSKHWNLRIGSFLPVRRDKWWTVSTNTEAILATKEILAILQSSVLPQLFSYTSIDDLANDWKLDNGFGLTISEIRRFLETYNKIEGTRH